MLYAVFVTWLSPIVIAPAFNHFEPLPDGPARQEILALADSAGVEVSDVLVVDAGRRSQAINAYVTGLGSSRRVVVYDNALNGLHRSELRSILAHELSHVKGRDVQRGLLWVILVAPLVVLCVQGAVVTLARSRGVSEGSAAIVPALALCLSVAVLVMGVPGQALSRQVEARADTFALELTNDPDGFIDLQRRLAETNLTDPAPPRIWVLLFSTHPPTLDRIGAALSYEREGGAGGD
jgi:STE24 endopeptidase